MDKFFRILEMQFNNDNPIYKFNHRNLYEFFKFQFKMMESLQSTFLNDYQKEIYIIGCMEDLNKRLLYVEDKEDSNLIVPVYQWIVDNGRVTYNMTYRFPSVEPVLVFGVQWVNKLGNRYKKNESK